MARARRGVMLRRLAERRGWNLRALYRDVETLRLANVRVENDRGWYRLPENWIPANAIDVRRDELLALNVARHLAPGLRGTGIGRSLESLWTKLSTPSRQTTLPLGDEASFRCPATGAIDLGPHCAKIDTLHDAIRTRRTLRIHYRKPSGEESDRVIEPSFLHWCPVAETLYVRGYCRERVAFRLFAVHRIGAVELLEEPFVRRADPDWDGGRGFRLWHGATVEHVSIRFTPAVAGEICERHWHTSQRLSDTADGGVVLELDVAMTAELDRWLLGYGPDAEVLAPTALADRIRRRHAEAAGLRVGLLPARRSGPAGASGAGSSGSRSA